MIEVIRHTGDRGALSALLALADDSAEAIAGYTGEGEMYVARDDGVVIGVLLLTSSAEPGCLEVKSVAVVQERHGEGLGRALVEHAIAVARDRGVRRLSVGTAAAAVGTLRFYQRLGFRMREVERDAFTPAQGYQPGLTIDGVPLLDRVWLDLEP